MGGRWRLRFAGADGLDHHVIGQVVFLRRIGGHCLGDELRLRRLPRLWPEQPRIALILSQPLLELFPLDRLVAPDIRPSVDADFLFPDVADGAADLMVGRGQRHTVSHLIGRSALQTYRLPLGRRVGKAIQLLLIQGAENGGQLPPGGGDGGKYLVVVPDDLYLQAGSRSPVTCRLADHKAHGLHPACELLGQALGNFGVALAVSQPLGNIVLVLGVQQAGGQHLPQVLVEPLRVGEKKFRDVAVALVLLQQPLKVLPRLQPADGVGQRGVQKLHLSPFQGGNLVLCTIQIDKIPRAVGGGERVAGLAVDGHDLRLKLIFRDRLLYLRPVLVGKRDVHFMGRLPVPDGDGIPIAGHWLLGQVRRGGVGQDGVGLVQHRLMKPVVEAGQVIVEA